MKTAIYFLSVCLALCLAACNNQNEPEPTPDHQPANPKTFSLAGKMYVGDSKTVEGLEYGWYDIFVFTEDSVWDYQNTNSNFAPNTDQYYYYETTYVLKYPNIEINAYPWPEVITMVDTLTIERYGNHYMLR